MLKPRLRLGLEYREETLVALPAPAELPDLSQLLREELLAIIACGGSGQSIPNTLAWQREIRADRRLPERD